MNPGTDWIEQARRVLDTLRQTTASSAQDSATAAETHAADCRWCPVCQVASVVRGERPEVTAALADVLTATATALRTFAEAAHPGPAADARTTAAQPTEEPAGEPPAVQRIDIA
jgi:hypothetical protein